MRIFPVSKRDRFLFWLATINAILFVFGILTGGPVISLLIWGCSAAILFTIIYLFPDILPGPEANEYSRMIDLLTGMSNQLADLSKFLQNERERVVDTEMTLGKLREEKAVLEPVIETERETVDAILGAYSSRLRSAVWKDRVIGFSLGVLSSLVAAMIFKFLSR